MWNKIIWFFHAQTAFVGGGEGTQIIFDGVCGGKSETLPIR